MKIIIKRALSVMITLVMLFTTMPLSVTARGEYVYLSISYDGQYINDKNSNPVVYMPVALEDIKSVDLAEYGLENMLYDADDDGKYETTALQLLIYAHETIYGGDCTEACRYYGQYEATCNERW